MNLISHGGHFQKGRRVNIRRGVNHRPQDMRRVQNYQITVCPYNWRPACSENPVVEERLVQSGARSKFRRFPTGIRDYFDQQAFVAGQV
jgi:hypothetical protein